MNTPTNSAALPLTACSALLLTWGNLQEAANWCGAADLYDTRYLLLIPTPSGEHMAQVGDTILKHEDGTFSVQNDEVSDRRAHGNENTTGANGGSLH